MRTLICILSVAAILPAGCGRDTSSAANGPLSFYVVHDEKIEGGRFIDTSDFPKLGYIAATPDLVIRRLQSVTTNGSLPFSEARPGVFITLRSEDAPSFIALTERAVGKQLLTMLGDTPLMAPQVREPVRGATLMLTPGVETDSRKQADDLKKLVH